MASHSQLPNGLHSFQGNGLPLNQPLIASVALELLDRGHFQMSEDSERMMLLLQELALLKEESEQGEGPQSGVSASKRKKEITREMKRLAKARKQRTSEK